jgi:Kef-type K+ transport system membrane component KefB
MSIFLFTGLLLFIAIYTGRLFHRAKLPVVTGYILIGFALGNIPFFSSHLSPYFLKLTNYVDEITLAVISFEMGMEFTIKALQKIEKKILIITICQAIITYAFIFTVFKIILHVSAPISMIIASIGIATAPDIIILVTREYNTKGKLIKYLKGIVTFDDLLTELAFIITIPIAEKMLHSYKTGLSPTLVITKEIILSVIIGILLGIVFSFIANEFRKLSALFSVTVGFILTSIGIAIWLNLHIIFILLIVGIVFSNLSRERNAVISILSQVDAPLFIIFLIVNGSALSIKLFVESGILGIAFILARGTGKVFGSYLGGKIINEPLGAIIGWSLLPQSEISIYLAILTKTAIAPYGNAIFTIAMSGVVIFEIIGAPILRYTLSRK